MQCDRRSFPGPVIRNSQSRLHPLNASTSNTLAGQKRLAASLIARYKRNADALPSTGFGLRAKVFSAILLMRGYEGFMYSKRNPYPKVIALLRWQLLFLECTRTSYSSTATEPSSKNKKNTKAKRSIANDLYFQDLYKNLWGILTSKAFAAFASVVPLDCGYFPMAVG